MTTSKSKEVPSGSNFTRSKQSEWSASRKASNEVLSNLCDKIQSVSGLMNGHVRRIFSLQDFVVLVERNEGSEAGGEEDGEQEVEFLPKD